MKWRNDAVPHARTRVDAPERYAPATFSAPPCPSDALGAPHARECRGAGESGAGESARPAPRPARSPGNPRARTSGRRARGLSDDLADSDRAEAEVRTESATAPGPTRTGTAHAEPGLDVQEDASMWTWKWAGPARTGPGLRHASPGDTTKTISPGAGLSGEGLQQGRAGQTTPPGAGLRRTARPTRPRTTIPP